MVTIESGGRSTRASFPRTDLTDGRDAPPSNQQQQPPSTTTSSTVLSPPPGPPTCYNIIIYKRPLCVSTCHRPRLGVASPNVLSADWLVSSSPSTHISTFPPHFFVGGGGGVSGGSGGGHLLFCWGHVWCSPLAEAGLDFLSRSLSLSLVSLILFFCFSFDL